MPKLFDYSLTDAQEAQLAITILRSKRPELTKRARAIWLLHEGVPVREVAATLEVSSRTTIYAWWRIFQESGLEGLISYRPRGRPYAANADYCEILHLALSVEPSALGYKQDGWTSKALRHHLEQETGISMSDRRFRDLLRRLNIRYERSPGRPFSAAKLEALEDQLRRYRFPPPLSSFKPKPYYTWKPKK